MLYHYYCEKCGKKEDKEFPMGNALDYIECDCGGKMKQDILSKKVQSHLSEDYKALSDYHSINYGNDEDMEKMLNI